MNNFVFNSVADELKTSVYAQSPECRLHPLQLDDFDRLLVAGVVALENSTLTVGGTITVSEIVQPITVSTILTPITIANATITSIIAGSTFTTDEVIDASISGTGAIFNNKDISTIKEATLFIYNRGVNTLTLSLQMSPTTNDGDYIDDPVFKNVAINQNEKKAVAISFLSRYIRLQYNMGAANGVITAYYNAQS